MPITRQQVASTAGKFCPMIITPALHRGAHDGGHRLLMPVIPVNDGKMWFEGRVNIQDGLGYAFYVKHILGPPVVNAGHHPKEIFHR